MVATALTAITTFTAVTSTATMAIMAVHIVTAAQSFYLSCPQSSAQVVALQGA